MSCTLAKMPCLFEQQMPVLLEHLPTPFICLTDNLQVKYFNSALANLLNLNNCHDLDLSLYDILPQSQADGKNSKDVVQEIIDTVLNLNKHCSTLTLKSRQGITITVQVTIFTLKDANQFELCCYLEPITYFELGFTEFAKTNEFIQGILHNLPIVMHIWSKDYTLVDCSHAVTQHFKIDTKEEYVNNYLKFSPELQPDGYSKDLLKQYLQEAFDKGICKFQWMALDSQGKIIPTEETLCRAFLDGEEYVVGYTQDISAITENILGINHMEGRMRAILDKTPMAIHIWDQNLRLRDCNLESLRIFGFNSKLDFLENYWRTFPKLQRNGFSSSELINNGLKTAFETGYYHFDDVYGLSSNNEEIPLEITLIRLVLRDEDMVIGYLSDLREITKVLNEVKQSEKRIQTILNITPLGIQVWNHDKELLDCNDSIVRLFGFANREEYMLNHEKPYPTLQPDGRNSIDTINTMVDLAFESNTVPPLELLAFDMNGQKLPVEITLKRTYLLGKEVVITFVRDLREFKAMLAEIHSVEKDLRSARDAAEQSAQAKSDFLANMSHEIRTPLNGVLGLLHLINNTQLDFAQKDYVEKTIFSASNLLRIINDILDFSKIDAGKMEMEKIPFTLVEVAEELKLLFEPQAKKKNLDLTFMDGSYVTKHLLGDPLRVKQIFFNLIGNALKFTENGSITISIKAEKVNDDQAICCQFSVKDSGIGMSEEQCSRLFSAFTQADTSVTRKYGGTGLGLVIAQRMARLMQGDLWVESTLGQGSTFFFTAVFEFASQESVYASGASYDITEENGHSAKKTSPKSSICALSHEQSQVNTQSHTGKTRIAHILLVEDNPINQLIAEELLKSVGHSVEIANNGQEALDLLHSNNYNLVLMDIQMPILDGLSAVERIRQDPKLKHMPVIAMSAHAMTGDKEKSLEHGMNDHITKPICPDTLFDTVQKWAKFKS